MVTLYNQNNSCDFQANGIFIYFVYLMTFYISIKIRDITINEKGKY